MVICPQKSGVLSKKDTSNRLQTVMPVPFSHPFRPQTNTTTILSLDLILVLTQAVVNARLLSNINVTIRLHCQEKSLQKRYNV